MSTAEQIQRYVRRLPPSLQTKVLDFVVSLSKTSEPLLEEEEGRNWSRLSLDFALRGMEDEEGPEYTADDLKESFS